jgi:hypothetical protein
VIFPLDDLQPVLRAMLRRYPPGSGVRWGWNTLDDHRAVIYTDRVAPVEEVVTATVRDVGSVSLWDGPRDAASSDPC